MDPAAALKRAGGERYLRKVFAAAAERFFRSQLFAREREVLTRLAFYHGVL